MIFDKLAEFADATALITATPTDDAIVGNVMDLGSAPTLKNLGGGQVMYWVLQVDTAIAGVNGTTEFKLVSDSTANLATSKTTHITTGAVATATLAAGYTFIAPLPATETYERYLGTWATQATATRTAGAVSSYITATPPRQYAAFLPDGIA